MGKPKQDASVFLSTLNEIHPLSQFHNGTWEQRQTSLSWNDDYQKQSPTRHEGLRETNWYWNFATLPKPWWNSHKLSWYLIVTCLFPTYHCNNLGVTLWMYAARIYDQKENEKLYRKCGGKLSKLIKEKPGRKVDLFSLPIIYFLNIILPLLSETSHISI